MTQAKADKFPGIRQTFGRGIPLYKGEPATIVDIFLTAESCVKPDVLNYKKDGKWHPISSNELLTRVRNIAAGLHSLGLQQSDRIAILAANSPEWTISDAACHFAGLIDVPIYTTLSPDLVEYVLKDSGSQVLLIDSHQAFTRIESRIKNCPDLKHVFFFEKADGFLSIEDLESKGAATIAADTKLVPRLQALAQPDDVATLIYTSGTTGEPKGVMLTHTNIVSNVLDTGARYGFSEADRPLSVLPLSHIFERSAMYIYILHSMSVHYAESIEKVPENLGEVSPTIFIGVPRIFEKVYARAKLKASQNGGFTEKIFDWAIEVAKEFTLCGENDIDVPLFLSLKHKLADVLVYSKLREFFGGNLRFCVTGGAALSDDIYLIFTGAGIGIVQGYGLTETSPVLTSNTPESHRLGTVGTAIRNVEIRIADDGEIEAKGPNVMAGYFNKPNATKRAFTKDGWFRTGDIGTIDGDGFLKITDRKKELFKTSGGKYIAPSPIEGLIRSSRFVSQVVLVGNERKFPAALIVPNFEQLAEYVKHKNLKEMNPQEMCSDAKIYDLFERQIAAATEKLSHYEKVKRFALLPAEFSVEGDELTPTLKIKRRVIDEKYKDIIDKIYADAEITAKV